MKKKTIVAALLVAGIAAGVGTQIHAQDTAYVCGGNHSGMHHTAHECIRTLQEQQAAKAAAEKRQAEAAQKQKAAASYAKTAAQSDTAVNANTAVNTDTAVSSQTATELPTSTPAQRTDTTNPAVPDCPYHENCDGTHHHNENCNGNHSFGEDCNNSRQGYHHGGEGGQGMHHGNGHHGR